MNTNSKLQEPRKIIETAFEQRTVITPENAGEELLTAIELSLSGLEQGTLRVAEPVDGEWQVNEWLKKAVLLYFRVRHNQVIDGSASRYFDKVPLRWAQGSDEDISAFIAPLLLICLTTALVSTSEMPTRFSRSK